MNEIIKIVVDFIGNLFTTAFGMIKVIVAILLLICVAVMCTAVTSCVSLFN